MSSQPKYLIIDESLDILSLFHVYCRIEYEDELWDECSSTIKTVINSFNSCMEYLFDYVNNNWGIVFAKPHWLTCPIGISLEFYLGFLDFYETSIYHYDSTFTKLPILMDRYGTTHYLGDNLAIKY